MIQKEKEYSRVFDILALYTAKYNKSNAFNTKINGEWIATSATEFINKVNAISWGLYQMGIRKDDKIAIVSGSRTEWNIVDFGIQQLGAISVPMYPTITVEDYKFIFKDAAVKLVFVSDEALLAKVKQATIGSETIQDIYTFNKIASVKNWEDILSLGKNVDFEIISKMKAAVLPNDLITLIYTSGTTGMPKGVMLSHDNLLSNVKSCLEYFPLQNEDKVLSFLPLCHIYERTVIYIYLTAGVSIFYAESMETIGENIKEVKPACFTSVPRLLEKVYDKIVAKGYELTGVKKSLFFWALNLGLKYDPTADMGWWYNTQLNLARKLIFSKWQEALGGNLKLVVSGSAALQPRLSRVFWAAGIPISEGYGLTETSPVVSSSMVVPKDFKVGCVGTVIKGVTVKIAEDGEILVKGPNVMKGYYNRPDATAEVFTADGWFKTGDIGVMVEDKYLKITDRKKEIFKTSGGKYVAPQQIENKLKESTFIEQCIVVGENQKHPSALIIPEFAMLKDWCKENNIDFKDNASVIQNTEVIRQFNQEVDRLMQDVAQYESVKKFKLLPRLFTVDDGELTAKLSLKRKVICEKNKDLIQEMYD